MVIPGGLFKLCIMRAGPYTYYSQRRAAGYIRLVSCHPISSEHLDTLTS